MADPTQGVFQGFDIAAAGLRAEMMRSEVVAANLGNMHRTGNAQKEPYRRKSVVFEEVLDRVQSASGVPGGAELAQGVRVKEVVEDRETAFPRYRNPGHPDADADGWVWGSNVDVFQELVDLSVIERSFEANLASMRSYRTMLQNTLNNMRSS
ncbi:MAG: flagellar basal body rod protein FlgC [Planctomycetota bacterium]